MGRDSISFSLDLVLRARHSTCVGKRCDIASLAGRKKLHLVVVVAGGEAGAWKIQDFPFPLATLPCRRPFKQFSCVGTAVAPVYNKRRGGQRLVFCSLCSTTLLIGGVPGRRGRKKHAVQTHYKVSNELGSFCCPCYTTPRTLRSVHKCFSKY